MEPSTIRTNCSGLGVGSLVTTKGYGFKIARQSKTLLSEPVRVPRQHRCSQGVQMTATIKTLHTKCNRFWTVQGPKLLQKMRPARSQWLQIQWNCRKPSVSGQKLCIITVYMLFLFKIQHVVLLQLQLLGMCKWGSVITVAWSRARHGEQNTAADVLISIAPHSEKGAYLIRDFVSSRNYFLAICRLWQHGVGAWPRLGVLGICDACMFLCVVLTLLPSSATSSLYFFLIVDERLFGSYYQFNCSSRWICRQIRESYVLVFAKMFCPFRTP
jgi:hypothetical protein